jgi:hypothetical protein
MIIHLTHHKCGTLWFDRIFRNISEKFNFKYQNCKQEKLEDDTDIWLEDHSRVDFTRLASYVGSHMIRDPRDIIISSYFYHLWCHEEWCIKVPYDVWFFNKFGTKPIKKPNKSYQQILNSLGQEQGILFEMRNAGRETIEEISKWNYHNPNIIEIRYEDFIYFRENIYRELFLKYGFKEEQIDLALRITAINSFENTSGRELGNEIRRNHLRKGVPGDWKNFFSEKHLYEFKKLFGDILTRLGYEERL